MSEYTHKITLSQNERGVWDLDPFKGCSDGLENNPNGCYGVCYAANIAKFRGYDFSKTIKRDFIDEKHEQKIFNKLKQIPFVRMGVSCDPSYNWYHTLNIVEKIKKYQKNIVIVTKHWKELSDIQLKRLNGVVINTSISAIDKPEQIQKRIFWYNKLVFYCKSVLRVNTAKFNLENEQGSFYNKIQNDLLKNEKIIDNILRLPKSHKLVKEGVILTKKEKFLDTFISVSKNNDKTFLGYCRNCQEQCGINLFDK